MARVQERGCSGGNPSKRWRNISERGGKRFLQELEKYVCKSWRNISARGEEVFLEEVEKYCFKRWRNISARDGEILLINRLQRETCKLS